MSGTDRLAVSTPGAGKCCRVIVDGAGSASYWWSKYPGGGDSKEHELHHVNSWHRHFDILGQVVSRYVTEEPILCKKAQCYAELISVISIEYIYQYAAVNSDYDCVVNKDSDACKAAIYYADLVSIARRVVSRKVQECSSY